MIGKRPCGVYGKPQGLLSKAVHLQQNSNTVEGVAPGVQPSPERDGTQKHGRSRDHPEPSSIGATES